MLFPQIKKPPSHRDAVDTLPVRSFLDDIGVVMGLISPALVPPQARARLERFAARVPSMSGGFEVRLHDPLAPIDVSLVATPEVPSALRILAGAHSHVRLPPGMASAPAWARAGALARDMLARGGGAQREDELLWLEFDDATLDAAMPTPCALVQRAGTELADLEAPALAAYRLLQDGDPPPAILAGLRALAHAIPRGATLNTTGVMAGRQGLPMRLRLHVWPTTHLADTLAAIWGDGSAALLRQAAAVAHPVEPLPDVTLDLYADGPVRVGIPLRLGSTNDGPGDRERRLEECLTLLTDRGLCTQGAAEGLRRWIGFAHDARPATGLPHESERPGARGLLVRTIVQFKLSFDADGTLRAKAYFGILQRLTTG